MRHAWLLFGLVGCSHIQYQRGFEHVTHVAADDDVRTAPEIASSLGTNEIMALDRSGVVCGALTNTMSEYGAAQDLLNQAERGGPGVYTTEYRQYSPAEFAGIDCGFYYRWGQGDGTYETVNYAPEDFEVFSTEPGGGVHAKYGEAGFVASGQEPIAGIDWFRWSASLKFGAGRYRFVSDTDEELASGVIIRLPLTVGLAVYPRPLQGFGVEPHVGYDVITGLLTKDRSGFVHKIDYGVIGRWGYPYKRVTFDVHGGYLATNVAEEENWVHSGGFVVGAGFNWNWYAGR